jgi:hypothetical protein
MSAAPQEGLRDLQAELHAIKAAWPALTMRRTPAAAGGPLPLALELRAAAPPDAAHIDVEALLLRVAVAAGAPPAVTVAVANEQLPARLRAAIAGELEVARRSAAAAGGAGALGLRAVFNAAAADFSRLLMLVPDALERYETTDAAGRTVRRVAVLRDDGGLTIEAPLSAEELLARMPPALRAEAATILRRHPGAAITPGAGGGGAEALRAGVAALALRPRAAAASPPLHLEVPVAPTDPSWPRPGAPLALLCTANPGTYPAAGSFSVRLAPAAAGAATLAATELECAVLDRLLAAEAARGAGRPGALRAVLRHAESHGGGLLAQAADLAAEVSRRRAAAAAEARAVAPPPLLESGSDARGDSSAASSSAASSSGDEGGAPRRARRGAASPARAGAAAADARRALLLTLDGLDVDGVDALEVLELRLQVACGRCGAAGELALDTGALAAAGGRRGAEAAAACPRCAARWAVSAAPRIVHSADAAVLAAVAAEGCAPRDLLPSLLCAQCSGCSAVAAFRAFQLGRWAERSCPSCHRRMALKAEGASFVPRAGGAAPRGGASGGGAPGGPAAAAPGRPGGAAEPPGLVVAGQPLPDRGACRHYPHSHRWLRFPCCGARFPCDLCHEEAVADGHPPRWATRHTCGYCAVEQRIEERCAACGRKLAASAASPAGRNTRFWEGGQGQRDPAKLSRRDPARWRNSRGKTRSNKARRVGPKATPRADA